MNISVLKFGGSSFRRLDDYRSVCDLLFSRLGTRPHRLVVVVSAMYGHTDSLLSAGRSLSSRMSGQASDALLTTGEFISAALLRIALEDRGIRAVSLNGYDLGILSDSSFTQAGIRSVDTSALRQALLTTDVIVVTGAQAVDSQGRITMLGRNSSDLTAVALAAALGLEECEIFSDVPGVYSADPYVFPKARLLRRLPHGQLIEMSRSGAKVIHFGAAEYARRSRVRILCRATAHPDQIGTAVCPDSPPAGAVVLDTRARVFEFDCLADLIVAERRLSAWGVVALRPDSGDGLVLAVTQGVLSVKEFLSEFQIPFREIDGHALLTIIRNSGEVERTLVRSTEARAIATSYHEDICDAESFGADLRLPEAVNGTPSPKGPVDPVLLPWLNHSC